MKNEILFKPKCGFHKTTLCGFVPHIIDTDRTDEFGDPILPIIYDPQKYVLSNNAVPYTSISIPHSKDFHSLKMNAITHGTTEPFPYCQLEFSPDNIIGLSNLDEYKDRINTISNNLIDRYGLELDTTNARLRSAEIACEFILPRPINEYWRALRILSYIQSAYSAEISDFWTNHIDKDNHWKYTLFRFKNYEFYIYNKTQQLKDTKNITLSKEICKFELRFPDINKMNNKLTYEINEMKPDTIDKTFLHYFNKSIRKPYENWLKEYDQTLSKLIQDYRFQNHWITDLLSYCSDKEHYKEPILLDIEDIINNPALKSSKNIFRTKRQLLRACKEHTIFQLETRAKIQEIFNAIDSCFKPSTPIEITIT